MSSPKISVKGKESRFGFQDLGFFTDDGSQIFIGKDWALQNEIAETKIKTQARSCYRECRSCGCCSNSRRDGSSNCKSYDAYAGKDIACTSCEKFRFCDCRNGYFRDAHGEAEPFTPDVIEMMRTQGGKPLI